MTHHDWTLLRTHLQAFVAGGAAPSIRDPEFAHLVQKIGAAIEGDDRARLAAFGCAALAAMLDHVLTSARAERQTALLIDSKRRA